MMRWWLIIICFVATGVPLHAHGNVHDFIVKLTEEITKAPNPARLYLSRADLYRIDGNYREAETDIKMARMFDPHLRGIAKMAAKIAHDQEKYEEEIAALNEYLAETESDGEAWVDRAYAHEQLGHTELAIADYRKALGMLQRVEPQYPCYLAWLLQVSGDAAGAQIIIERYAEQFGRVPVFVDTRIRLARAQNNTALALSIIDEQIAASPRPEGWWVQRANILRESGDVNGEREALQSGLNAIERLPMPRQQTIATQVLLKKIKLALQEGNQ